MLRKINTTSDNKEKNKETTFLERLAVPREVKNNIKESIADVDKNYSNPRRKLGKAIRALKISKKGIPMIILGLLFVGALATSGYFFYQYKELSAGNATKNETEKYVAKIGKFMILPEGETPTLATVADKDKLSGQLFFANAKNGDKMFFYAKAQKAILYRPSENKIVEMASMSGATLNSREQNTESKPSEAATQPETQKQAIGSENVSISQSKAAEAPKMAKVAVYNGTTQKGLAKNISVKLAGLSDVDVVLTGNATGSYAKTAIIDLSGNNTELVKKLINTIGGEISSFSDTETKPDADILVIGGSDFKN